jgi:lysozyme
MDNRSRITLAGAVLVAGLAGHEGRELVDYWDRIPRTPVATACYGHTATAKVGTVRTVDECNALLTRDLTEIYGPAVIGMVKVPITQGQYNALVDFAYNLGIANLRHSTLLRKLNAGDKDGASREFAKWKMAGDKDCTVRANGCYGIIKRREWERQQFVSDGR